MKLFILFFTFTFFSSCSLICKKEVSFWENGQPKEIKSFKKNKVHGKYITYSDVGNIIQEGKFKKGKKVGWWKHYYKSQLVRELKYTKGDTSANKVITHNIKFR